MAGQGFRFPKMAFPDDVEALRQDIRGFLRAERASGGFTPIADCWGSGLSPEFSRKLGQRGYLAVTWPKAYGGHEKTMLHRYVITEELVSAGAPVGAHWVADRQSGPLLLRYGTEEQKTSILPRIAAGECYFAIGMSEPGSGSDLASVRTRAEKVDGGWKINGAKIWSSGAHICHYMIALVRTTPVQDGQKHRGLSQFLVDLSTPGISVRGIKNIANESHFNETVFQDVFVPDDAMLGNEGDGWKQVTGELAIERSGPERFLSTTIILEEAVRAMQATDDDRIRLAFGQLVARLRTLRRMSLGVSALLQEGQSPETEAALVKEVGTRFEREIIEGVRGLSAGAPTTQGMSAYHSTLRDGILHIPSSTIRGGTNEVLKGIVARQLGLR
ncbi:MAG: acyl-CoA dehydrogenase family protein [Alphaproteobacteria bacterium]|nr:acyl-CoA dehydrogenase family protein [Alphaproteobacteria bacterium]MCB9930224.1 acyl-CoA dehydrogenase family protein [Alphaproteobacteria bacterium]